MWPTAVAPLASRQGFTSAAVGATAAAAWYKTTLMEEASSTDDTADTVNDLGPIEINLMDKISNKIYLNPSRVRSSNLKKRNSDTAPPSVVVSERPVGVPSSLRILAIDLPEMREQAFSRGECRVAFNAVYPDGIAPPKTVVKQEDENGDKRELVVEQKAWVRSLVKCVQSDLPDKVGVEMMEASFSHLNPKNLRKTRQLGGYHYDPGKYTDSKEQDQSRVVGEKEVQEDDELDAPWHQQAWIEELKLRIRGQVPFGDALEPSSRWDLFSTGSQYKATVASQSNWMLPSFLQSEAGGIDGTDNSHNTNSNWASNKPHAVVANGAAVQRMPSGLRLLQKTCRDAKVPLFVLHDPRAWGGNTHHNLHQALRDVRYVVKQNIIISAMEHQSGFSRGRHVGRIERSIEQWMTQAKQDRQRRQEALKKRQWQKLDAATLEKRLIEHGVLRREDRVEDGKTYRQYTPAMKEIAQQCVEDMKLEDGQTVAGNVPSKDDEAIQQSIAGSSTAPL